jgi:hypothetical protein
MGDTNGASLIEIGDQEEVEDPFLAFLDYARTVISPEDDEGIATAFPLRLLTSTCLLLC